VRTGLNWGNYKNGLKIECVS